MRVKDLAWPIEYVLGLDAALERAAQALQEVGRISQALLTG